MKPVGVCNGRQRNRTDRQADRGTEHRHKGTFVIPAGHAHLQFLTLVCVRGELELAIAGLQTIINNRGARRGVWFIGLPFSNKYSFYLVFRYGKKNQCRKSINIQFIIILGNHVFFIHRENNSG